MAVVAPEGAKEAVEAGTGRWPRRRRRLRAVSESDTLWFIGTAAMLVLLWESAIRIFGVPSYVLPSPFVVMTTAVDQGSALLHHSWATAQTVLLGFGLSVAVGIPLGAAIVYVRVIERIVSPILVVTQTIPKVALAPLFVVWFGHGMQSKALVAFAIAFFPIVIDTIVGLRSVKKGSIQLVRSMGATRLQVFTKVQFPGALPSIFGGLKVAITLAIVGAVVGEYIASNEGLGYLQIVAGGVLNTPLLFAAVVAMSVLGLLFYKAVELVERAVIPWHLDKSRN
jgi:NitT/TauT family transport system permease protein